MARPKKAAIPPGQIEVEATRHYSHRAGNRAAGARFLYDYEDDPHGFRAQGLVKPVKAPEPEA